MIRTCDKYVQCDVTVGITRSEVIFWHSWRTKCFLTPSSKVMDTGCDGRFRLTIGESKSFDLADSVLWRRTRGRTRDRNTRIISDRIFFGEAQLRCVAPLAERLHYFVWRYVRREISLFKSIALLWTIIDPTWSYCLVVLPSVCFVHLCSRCCFPSVPLLWKELSIAWLFKLASKQDRKLQMNLSDRINYSDDSKKSQEMSVWLKGSPAIVYSLDHVVSMLQQRLACTQSNAPWVQHNQIQSDVQA